MKSKSTKKNLDIWNDYHYEKKNPYNLNQQYMYLIFPPYKPLKSYMINHKNYIVIVLNYRYASA